MHAFAMHGVHVGSLETLTATLSQVEGSRTEPRTRFLLSIRLLRVDDVTVGSKDPRYTSDVSLRALRFLPSPAPPSHRPLRGGDESRPLRISASLAASGPNSCCSSRPSSQFEVPVVRCQPRIDTLHDGDAAVSEIQCAWRLLAAMARVALDSNSEEPVFTHPVTIRP